MLLARQDNPDGTCALANGGARRNVPVRRGSGACQQVVPILDVQHPPAKALQRRAIVHRVDALHNVVARLAKAPPAKIDQQLPGALAALLTALLTALFAPFSKQHFRSRHLGLLTLVRVTLDRIVEHRKEIVLLLRFSLVPDHQIQ
ncbi:MAG TPA: hypothetical protein VKT77_08530, partial [Chthonomonadaceae bacterium]|nr:hypothetical protein [Chthonomonadaceae bacterium]